MSGAEPDGDLIIVAHSHAQRSKPVAFGDLCQQGEMKRGFVLQRRYAHQPGNRQAQIFTAFGDKCISVLGRNARLLIFLARVDLNKTIWPAALRVHFPGQRARQFRPIKRLDDIEQVNRAADFIGLQRADKMERCVRVNFLQAGPLAIRFLNAVLAKHPVSGLQRETDFLGGMSLGHGNQCNPAAVPDGGFLRLFDSGFHLGQVFYDIGVVVQ